MAIQRRLRSILWRVPVEQEVHDEMAHHLALRAQELVDRGLDPAQARAEAERRLGDVRQMEAELVRLGRGRNRAFAWREWLDELRQDVRFALRQCRRSPGFTTAAVITLALGIGATTAIFSLVYAVILKPFPFTDPERVLSVYTTWRGDRNSTSGGNYRYLRERVTTLEYLAASYPGSFNLADDGTPERVPGVRTTWDYFRVAGTAPLLGRTFTEEEDRPGGALVTVLSHRLWQRRFGGDRTIVGRRIQLNGQGYDVIGVMPPAFDELGTGDELWIPAAFTPARLEMYDEHFLNLYGLRKPEYSLAQVNEELTRIVEGLRRDHPDFNTSRGAGAAVYGDLVTADSTTRLFVLLAAVGLVLLIACGNVANLLLARLAARSRELAIRTAIGAARGRLVRQILTESLVLSSIGAMAGLMIAWWMVPALVAMAPPGVPRLRSAELDTHVLAVAVGLALASAALVGLLPSWQATSKRGIREDLGDGKGAAGTSVRPWIRQTLIAAQAALVLIVLAGAALLVRSAINMQHVPLGFDPSGTLSARVGLIGPAYRHPAVVKEKFAQLVTALQAAPGVQLAALDSAPPLMAGAGGSNGLIPEGRPINMESIINSRSHFVTPDYFRALRIELKAGRLFTADDVREAPFVMIINETLARRAFGTDDPIGKRLSCCEGTIGKPHWKTVVGVVSDVRSRGPAEETLTEFYLPLAQIPDVAWSWVANTLNVVVRPESGDPTAMAGAIRDAVRQIDPTLPVFNVSTFDEGLRRSTAQARFNTLLMSALGATGLVLAALGIYSVIAWLISQRKREIGVRIALGASAGGVVRQMTLHGLRPVAIGLVVGLLGALLTGRWIEQLLFQVGARDPMALASVSVLLLVVGALAAILPAWRAASIDPATTLRDA